MKITFIHTNKAFLPEIGAYRDFFSTFGVDTVTGSYDDPGTRPDVEWHFMGTRRRPLWKDTVVIHEYASASVPPLRGIKDLVKRWYNATPDYRLFLNPYVRQRLAFRDAVPFGFRDMGLAARSIRPPRTEKEKKQYDFIYTGSVSADMQMEKLLQAFSTGVLKEHTLLVLSREYEPLARQFSSSPNIIFKGPVPHAEVSGYLQQAQFGINYKPVVEPHSHQTSTRFIEYLAAGIPVITTASQWIYDFQKQYGGRYFYLRDDLSNLGWEPVYNFRYSFPDLAEWLWEKQIRRSGVLEFLQARFPATRF